MLDRKLAKVNRNAISSFGRSDIDSASAEKEANGCPLREQLSTTMLDNGECPEAVVLQLENEIGVVEWQRPLLERHWLELKGHR
jgi:hypothetical protein